GLHATVYDGWRHVYFVYPAFLFLSVLGLITLYEAARPRLALPALAAGCALSLLWTAWEVARDHPYQNVYFNFLAGPDLQTIKGRFEMDYLGLSCREGLEKLLERDPSPRITVYAETSPIRLSAILLPAAGRARLRFTDKLDEADYYASHYRRH